MTARECIEQPEKSQDWSRGTLMRQVAKGALAFSILLASCASDSHVAVEGDTVFTCPGVGCEVATDPEHMLILLMHQMDTPGDKGAFDSASRTKMYNDAVAAGKILTVVDGSHGKRVYQTPPAPDNPVTYSVVELSEGSYSGRRVVVKDDYLK